MRFFTLILFFTIATIIVAQNNIGNSNIDDSDKKKLENKFKALSTFYIDDTGLVVYKNQEPTGQNQEPTGQNQSLPKKNESVIKSKSVPDTDVIIISEPAPEPYIITVESETSPTVKKQPSNEPPIKIYKENVVSKPRENIVVIDKQPISAPKKKGEQVVVIKEDADEQILVEDTDPDKKTITDKPKKVKPQGSIFDRKRTSQYKNMEEAALAVESLLSELKKEQSTLKSSGSMSSRLSRGVTKDLRKKNDLPPTNGQSVNSAVRSVDNYSGQSPVPDDYGLEPSYFINGEQVDKIEINKLQKSDIINREIRTRNTVTNNPNGEVWYTVKVASEM